jgi:hypothetical protein
VIEKQITVIEIKSLLERHIQSAIKNECWTCECFQGFITQLEIDSTIDIYNLVDLFKIVDENLHKCLGCKPCPPADLFTEYLRNRN